MESVAQEAALQGSQGLAKRWKRERSGPDTGPERQERATSLRFHLYGYIWFLIIAILIQGWCFQDCFGRDPRREQAPDTRALEAHHGRRCHRAHQFGSAPHQQPAEAEFKVGQAEEGECQEGRTVDTVPQSNQRTFDEGARALHPREARDQRSHRPDSIGAGQIDERRNGRRRTSPGKGEYGHPRGAHHGDTHEAHTYAERYTADAGDHQADAGGPSEAHDTNGRTATAMLYMVQVISSPAIGSPARTDLPAAMMTPPKVLPLGKRNALEPFSRRGTEQSSRQNLDGHSRSPRRTPTKTTLEGADGAINVEQSPIEELGPLGEMDGYGST